MGGSVFLRGSVVIFGSSVSLPSSYAIWRAPGTLHGSSTHQYVLVHAVKWSHSSSSFSHLFSFSHTPVHTNTHTSSPALTCCRQRLCPRASFTEPSPSAASPWHSMSSSSPCSPLCLGAQTLVGAVPRASLGSHQWEGAGGKDRSWQGLLSRGEVLGGTRGLKVWLPLVKDPAFSSARCQKHSLLDSHNRSSLFSHLLWGIMQVNQFFPSDFGSSQGVKKDVDICVFLGSIPPVMIERFVWFSSFCWHCQQLLPLFYGTSVRQQWLCQIVSYFPQFSIFFF